MLRLRALLLTALLGLLGACGGEDPIRDDGSQGIPLAGQSEALEAAGVEVLSAGAPATASGAEVGRALAAEELAAEEVEPAGDDPVAGLVTARGDVSRLVVLVFDGPASAALFADDADGVLTAGGDPTTFLAGNLVGVAVQHAAGVRSALLALAEVT